jgi:hypothetical protein
MVNSCWSNRPPQGAHSKSWVKFRRKSTAAAPSCRARLSNRGGTARHAGLYQDNIPILVARDRKGTTFHAVLPQVDGASVGAALAGVVTPGNHLIGDGGKAIAAFARRAGIPFHAVPAPVRPTPEAPHLHINNVNATTVASSSGSTASTASPPRTCPTISAGDAPSKPGTTNSTRQTGSTAPSETDRTNRQRYKSQKISRPFPFVERAAAGPTILLKEAGSFMAQV